MSVYQSIDRPISQFPKLCVKITIFMQGHVLIADWSVAYFVVRDNVRCSSWAHWKARIGLPISDN